MYSTETLYLSGSLKNKTIEFYKETIYSFDSEGFGNDKFYFGFDGSITPPPFPDATALKGKMKTRQEELINGGIKNTYKLARQRSINKDLIYREINKLRESNRNYAYALFECLYNIIYKAKTPNELKEALERFRKFREYLDSFATPINQSDLDIMIELFMEGKNYSKDDILKRKSEKFHIGDTSYLSKESQTIISLGEFIAPTRLPVISSDIQHSNEFTRYVAPIYFAVKDSSKSDLFLRWCRTATEIDYEFIKNKCNLCQIPNNILELVRRKN